MRRDLLGRSATLPHIFLLWPVPLSPVLKSYVPSSTLARSTLARSNFLAKPKFKRYQEKQKIEQNKKNDPG